MMKILVVEDERLLADSLQTLLTGRGFSVDTANDGLTGLEYAKTDVYDLVILDVMMPGLDGYTVASRLRAEHHAVPILMLTAKSASCAPRRAMTAISAYRSRSAWSLSPLP